MKIVMGTLKPIKREPIMVEFSSDEVLEEFNELIEKSIEMDGIPDADKTFNKCPKCGGWFVKVSNYCDKCGQRVRFVDSDIVPL